MEPLVPEVLVGLRSAFGERDVKVKVIAGREIGVFRLGDEFFAYDNNCPHAGGPVCQGRLMNRVEESIATDGTSCGARFSRDDVNIVCPWHGYEFDVRTGRHQGQQSLRLRSFTVRLDGDQIFATV
jgi:nitrite reductase/ring-hydroxylating ferredoxin subunit